MKATFDDFRTKYSSDVFKIRNILFKDIFGEFSFYLIEESEINSEFDQQASEKIMNSQNLFVDICILQDNQIYFLINIEQALIIINSQNLHLLKKYFPTQKMPEIYFFQDAEENFKKCIDIQYNTINQQYSIFDNTNFSNIDFNIDSIPNNEFWRIIKRIMLFNILSKSYSKTLQNRIDTYIQNAQHPNFTNFDEIDSNEFILINPITKLFYYIKAQSLVVLKKFQQNEISNLSAISHPLIPKFYGVTTFEGKKTLVIEYVNGETLEKCIENGKITEDEDKFDYLMHIMVAIEYLHTKFYAYRNLTPKNVIIDHNKTAVLIDFDRTKECSSIFSDPDIQNNVYSFKSDVYSFGLMIYYILTSNSPKPKMNINIEYIPEKYSAVRKIIMKCIQENKEDRPSFPTIFCDFYLFCKEYNLIRGFGKAIRYFMFAAEKQNDEIAQCHLGFIYLDPSSPFYDIEKAVHYLTLAADKNNLYSQNFLGSIYLHGHFVSRDIDKAIHFLSLAANQNHEEAQLELGCIYFDKSIGFYDIEKAIRFFKEVSSCNNYASNNLGVIYKNGLGVDKDIQKAIDYFKDAINMKNDLVAMFNLAHTYCFEEQNLSKSLKLLLKVVQEDVPYSFELLCLVVLKKFQPLNEDEIKKEFDDIDKNSAESLARRVCQSINGGLNEDRLHDQLKNVNYVYYTTGADVLK